MENETLTQIHSCNPDIFFESLFQNFKLEPSPLVCFHNYSAVRRILFIKNERKRTKSKTKETFSQRIKILDQTGENKENLNPNLPPIPALQKMNTNNGLIHCSSSGQLIHSKKSNLNTFNLRKQLQGISERRAHKIIPKRQVPALQSKKSKVFSHSRRNSKDLSFLNRKLNQNNRSRNINANLDITYKEEDNNKQNWRKKRLKGARNHRSVASFNGSSSFLATGFEKQHRKDQCKSQIVLDRSKQSRPKIKRKIRTKFCKEKIQFLHKTKLDEITKEKPENLGHERPKSTLRTRDPTLKKLAMVLGAAKRRQQFFGRIKHKKNEKSFLERKRKNLDTSELNILEKCRKDRNLRNQMRKRSKDATNGVYSTIMRNYMDKVLRKNKDQKVDQ